MCWSRSSSSGATRSVEGVQLTHDQYEALERAVRVGERVAAYRRGTEYIVVPQELVLRGGRERSEEQRLNSSHLVISYAVFCLKKKKKVSLCAGIGIKR